MGRKRWRLLWAFLAFALIAGACGDDGDDDGGGGAEQTTTEASDAEPVSGGELVVLFQSERRALDPVTATPSGASTGPTDFMLYGALVGYDSAANEVKPILAESLESNATFDVWTLKIKSGLKFTDGSTYDADAVKLNWERGKDPATRSSSFGILQSVTTMTIVDPLTLEIKLAAPNAVFDAVVSKFNINYIASAQAIRSGHDLTSSPVGAGPFKLETWTRDDRMILVRNPGWYDAPRPYLDRVVVRIVPDEEQRVDTFLTGDADMMYTGVPTSVTKLEDNDFSVNGVPVAHGSVISMNATRPPFNDPSMREFLAKAIDYQALLESGFGPDAVAATSFTPDEAAWHNDESNALPEYDAAAAQKLLDAYVAKNGPVQISCMSGQATTQQAFCKFAQTSLSQFKGITVGTEPVDTPTLIQRSYGHDFDFATWGFPTTYPDPGLFLGVTSTSSANPMGYKNTQVDSLFADARKNGDPDARVDTYAEIYDILTKELPFRPLQHPLYAYGFTDKVHDVSFYEDAIPRTDLIWIEQD